MLTCFLWSGTDKREDLGAGLGGVGEGQSRGRLTVRACGVALKRREKAQFVRRAGGLIFLGTPRNPNWA